MKLVPEIPLSENDRWMRPSEVAKLFGLTRESIANWRKKGTLPGYRVGERNYWFKKSDVNALLSSRGLPTI